MSVSSVHMFFSLFLLMKSNRDENRVMDNRVFLTRVQGLNIDFRGIQTFESITPSFRKIIMKITVVFSVGT